MSNPLREYIIQKTYEWKKAKEDDAEGGGDECPTRTSTSSRVGPHGKCCECPWPEGGGDGAE